MKRRKGTLPDPTPAEIDKVCRGGWDETPRQMQRKILCKMTARVYLLEELVEQQDIMIAHALRENDPPPSELVAEVARLKSLLGID